MASNNSTFNAPPKKLKFAGLLFDMDGEWAQQRLVLFGSRLLRQTLPKQVLAVRILSKTHQALLDISSLTPHPF